MRRGRLSVTHRLFVLVAVALVPMVAILAWDAWTLRQNRETEMRALALRFGQLASLEMERIISGATDVLEAVAVVPAVRSLDPTACSRYLGDAKTGLSQFTAIAVIDAAGLMRCRSTMPAGAFRFEDEPYFRDVLRTGAPTVGVYVRSPVSGRASLPVAVPLKDAGGRTVGVVAAGIDLDWLGERLSERDYLKGSALTVAGRDGVIIAREPLPERFVGTRIPEPFLQLVSAPTPGAMEVVSQDGTARVIGYYPVSASSSGLYVSAGISKTEAFGPIASATRRSFWLALLAAGVAFATAWAVGREFFRKPVRRIVATIRAWRDGDETARTGMMAGASEFEIVGVAVDEFLDELVRAREARQRTEAQRELLVRELDHRIKNILAMVQSVARQTFKDDGASPERLEAFAGRLAAMAKAHEILMADRWTSAEIGEAIRAPLSLFDDVDSKRFAVDGPNLTIRPKAALTLAMAVHELCTNAAKYGALASDDGRVAVAWSIDENGGEPRFSFSWTERGGPPVSEPRTRGFGSRMIASALAAELSADVRLLYRPEGFECFVSGPLAALLADSGEDQAVGGKNEVQVSSDTASAPGHSIEAAA